MKDENEFREICAAYALGALEKNEREEFELFLQHADEECLEILREYQDTVMQLPLAVRQHPSNHLRKQILNAVHKRNLDSISKNHFTSNRLVMLHRRLGLHKPIIGLATIAALMLLGFGLLIYSYILHENLGEQQNLVMDLRNELMVNNEYLSILESRQLEYVRLEGSDPINTAFGKLICDLGQKRALLQMSNLPPQPDDKTYHLWVTKNGHVVNKGRLEISENRSHTFILFEDFEIDDVSETDEVLFAITLEAESSRTKPSGEILMSGSPVML